MPFDMLLKRFSNSYLLSFLCIFLALYLRLNNYNDAGLWGDEYLTFWNSEPLYSFSEIFDRVQESPTLVPPFYYYILNLYTNYFDHTVYSLKLFHIFLNSSCLILVFFISRYILKNSLVNFVLFLTSFNLFLIWCSQDILVVNLALFIQLVSVLIFFDLIKSLETKINFFKIIFFTLISILTLTIHPLSIVIIFSQAILLLLLLLKDNDLKIKKKIYFILFVLFFACVMYIFTSIEYIINRLDGTSIGHNQLNLEFFIGYNFKHYFSSYIIGAINLVIVALSILKLRKNFFKNLHLSYLITLLLSTYIFIILGTTIFTGINGQRYWPYLVPIILIINACYIIDIRKKFIRRSLIFFLIIFTPIVYFKNINSPQVRKPDTPSLINAFNKSKVEYVVSQNYGYFEYYLKNGYENFTIPLLKENQIQNIQRDFWYLCLDLNWHQEKGSYWNEMYDCKPYKVYPTNHKRKNSLRFNGYVITKYEYIN
tara:strand:- start:634 stop:2082 length:1449 start_codon:yes stop_codon:yes gene_type:complete